MPLPDREYMRNRGQRFSGAFRRRSRGPSIPNVSDKDIDDVVKQSGGDGDSVSDCGSPNVPEQESVSGTNQDDKTDECSTSPSRDSNQRKSRNQYRQHQDKQNRRRSSVILRRARGVCKWLVVVLVILLLGFLIAVSSQPTLRQEAKDWFNQLASQFTGSDQPTNYLNLIQAPTPTVAAEPTITPTSAPTATPTNTPEPTRVPKPTVEPITAVPTPALGVFIGTPHPTPRLPNHPTETSTPSPVPTSTPTATPTSTFTPTPTETATPTLTPVPTFTATPTFTPEPTSTFTPVPTLTPVPASGIAPEELQEAKQLMLELINQARLTHGLKTVKMGTNSAAQFHAEDMRTNCFSSHWGSNGLKPFMRYTLLGGQQNASENINGTSYCPPDSHRYRTDPVEVEVRSAFLGLMDSPGHRANILRPYHRSVNIGIAFKHPNYWIVQLFEGDYISYDVPPSIDDGILSFSATLRGGADATAESLGVQIYYDPPPHELSRGQLHRTYGGCNGKIIAAFRMPLSGHRYYTEDQFTRSDPVCVDPYAVSPDSAPASSYEHAGLLHSKAVLDSFGQTAPYVVPWITAKLWRVSSNQVSVSADVSDLIDGHGNGVYSILIWAVVEENDVPISEYAIFIPPR